MRDHMKRKPVHLDIWRWDGYVLLGETSASFAAWVLQTMGKVITPGEHARGSAFLHPDYPWALWVKDLTAVTVLAHEALHITAAVLEARGVAFKESGEEAYTYTLQYIMDATLAKGGWSRAR